MPSRRQGILLLDEELSRKNSRARWCMARRRGINLRSENPFDLNDIDFRRHFRLTKDLANILVKKIVPHMKRSNIRGSISSVRKILATLHVLGSGGYQFSCGSNYAIGMSQSSLSRSVREVVPLIVRELQGEVSFPETAQKRAEVASGFQRLGPFEHVLGCIDCTHVRIVRPTKREEDFLNHKSYHSINAEMICDANLRILHVNATFPGRVHDQFIWSQSNIFTKLKNLNERRVGDFYLLGDSGYALDTFMMTPILNAAIGSPEDEYTKAHCSVRNSVERCFGVLKSRWRILHSSRIVTYNYKMAMQMINCCAILHNMCIDYNVPEPTQREINEAHRRLSRPTNITMGRAAAIRKREAIIGKYFRT